MNKQLIPEIQKILNRYNTEKYIHCMKDPYGDSYNEIGIEDFEERMDFSWISKNYHVSCSFIYEYHEKLDMKYLYDNHVITHELFEKIKSKLSINDRFEILDL